jgi:hypothetical protein
MSRAANGSVRQGQSYAAYRCALWCRWERVENAGWWDGVSQDEGYWLSLVNGSVRSW